MADKVRHTLELSYEWEDCTRCPLHKTRNLVVFGEGNVNADLMLVGDKGGPTEDEKGWPFEGETGLLLNNILKRLKIKREDVYIDNAVACWPCKKNDRGRLVTREASPEEINACKPRIMEAIYRIDPLAIVAFGAPTLKALTGVTETITKARGGLFFASVPGVYKIVKSYPVFPTFNPAYSLRRDRKEYSLDGQPAWTPDTIKRTIYEDLLRVRDFTIQLRQLYMESEPWPPRSKQGK